MKRFSVLVLLLCLCAFVLCSCVRTGERDSLDFVSSMAKCGFDLTADEISSADEIKESYYTNDCRITVCSNENSKMYRLILTYSKTAPESFVHTAKSCIMSFSGADEQLALEIMNTLGVSQPLPDSTKGVARCESEYFLYSFTSDKAGGCLIIDSLRLSPTSSPTVTVRTTVPKVILTEETASS